MDAVRTFLNENLTLPLHWPVALAASIALIVVLEILYRILFKTLQRLAQHTTTTLDDVLVRRMRLPAQVLVFLLGAHLFFALMAIENATVSKVVTIVELLLVCYLVIEAFETAVLHYWLGERKQVAVPPILRQLLLVIAYTVAILSVVGTVTGVNVAPLLATSTVISVVVGLALQDTLGNLFAGLALGLERPFHVGDWILVDNIEGRVVYMGWRAVHLQTFTLDVVVMPNSVAAKARMQNFYRPERVTGRNVEVLVPLHASPEDFHAALVAASDKVPLLADTPRPKSWLIGYTPLGQRYIARIWCKDFQSHDDAESDFLKALFHELRAKDIYLSPVAALAVVDNAGLPGVGAAPGPGPAAPAKTP